MKTRVEVIVIFLIGCFYHATAQHIRFFIEVDPATFAFGGYSLHARIQPANCEHWLFGIGSYGMRLPDPFVDLNPNNRSEGWDVRISNAYAGYAEYYFSKANNKWFVGEQVGLQNFRVGNSSELVSSDGRFTNMLLMTYLGYNVYLWKSDFYLKPWAGLGYTEKVHGSSKGYDVAPLFPFVTFHLGYRF